MIKLSSNQLNLLKLFAQSKSKGFFWIPPNGDKEAYLESEGRYIAISGSGVAKSIRSLWDKGLAIPINEELYWSEITDEGLKCL